MVNITKETYGNNGIEAIVDNVGNLWLNEKHIEEELDHKNLPVVTNEYDPVYKKHRYELLNDPEKQLNRRFLRSNLALKMIMNCKTDESCNLKRNLGFNLHDVINTKGQTVLESITEAFQGEDMPTQYSALGYGIDLYFHKYRLPIEVDELGHANRNLSDEINRQKALERELNCVFIRINPDEKDFNIFREINKIHRHINKMTKKSLIDDISERLLKLEFKSDHSIKSICLKWIVKKILPDYKE